MFIQISERLLETSSMNGKKPDGHRMILLKAQMQAGKTGVIRHICYLLNVQKEYLNLKIDEDNVHVLCNLSDNALVRQTRERLEGVMIFPAMNINHPAVSAFTKDGTGKNGRIATILANIKLTLTL
jgi:chloramphenicol 3-O-phosphotransferase